MAKLSKEFWDWKIQRRNDYPSKIRIYSHGGVAGCVADVWLEEFAPMIEAAPDMHEVLKEFVKGKVFSHPDAVHPSKLFCKHCGLNSRELIHSPGCLVEKAETAIAKAEGREV